MHGDLKKWSFLGGNLKGPEGTKRRKEWMGVWQDVFTAVMFPHDLAAIKKRPRRTAAYWGDRFMWAKSNL
ncbi:hypothetical protein NQZ68_037747 [Dissostichus eleginoides]|nr:hypothetical protein NQZ68_037747 [Dissostichus eleginoides]